MENKANGNNAASEFENDIKELLNSSDVQCKQDICEIEYKKAEGLMNENKKESVVRALGIMNGLSVKFDYIPALMWMGHFFESVNEDRKAAAYFAKASTLGDGEGARCYADMLMIGKGVEQNESLACEQYLIASQRGVPEAMFVIGQFYDRAGNKEKAYESYMNAYKNGYEPAKELMEIVKTKAQSNAIRFEFAYLKGRSDELSEFYNKSSGPSFVDRSFDAELINTLTFDTPDEEEESVKNKAFEDCVNLTKEEDIEQIKLGIRRIYGLGMVLDYSPAMLWMGFFSNDILKDYNEAANWFRRAAAKGNGMGMFQYGMLMLEDKVAIPSGVSVKRCFTDAFDRGIDEAKSILNKHFS